MLTLAGCGNGESRKAAPSASTVTVTSQVTAQPSSEPDPTADWHGKMIATYEPANSSDAVTGRDLMRRDHLLEDLADGINESLKLPQDIPLIGKQCDEANAYWSSGERTMTICYEDAADALDIYTSDGDPDPVEATINSEVATFYHEAGHMAIDLYNLPVTGREEDVADQLAAYVLLTPTSSRATAIATVRSTRVSSPTPTRWTSPGCTTWSAGSTAPIRAATPTW